MNQVPAEVMEATWVEVASLPDSRARAETQRLQREQPDLFEYVLGATEGLPPDVHALGFYVFLVIWRAFERAGGRIRRVKAGAIERRLEQNVDALSQLAARRRALSGAHARWSVPRASRRSSSTWLKQSWRHLTTRMIPWR